MPSDYDTLMELIRGRRSIRRYADRPVAPEHIDQLVEAARWAPSAGNRQAFRILVVSGPGTRAALARAVEDRIAALRARLRHNAAELAAGYLDHFTHFAGAPVVLAPIYRVAPDLLQAALGAADDQGSRAGGDSLCSCSAAIMNLLLAAHALGLGACWMTGPLVARPELEALLQVARGWSLAALVPVGFPAEEPAAPGRRSAERLVRKLD